MRAVFVAEQHFGEPPALWGNCCTINFSYAIYVAVINQPRFALFVLARKAAEVHFGTVLSPVSSKEKSPAAL
jgi:hypothetical protein